MSMARRSFQSPGPAKMVSFKETKNAEYQEPEPVAHYVPAAVMAVDPREGPGIPLKA